jgi:hypothetical protein
MFTGVRKPSRLPDVRSAICVVITLSLALCGSAIAAPSRGWTRSAHARRDRVVGRSSLQRAIAEHNRVDSRLFRLTHSRTRARAATGTASGLPFQRGDVFVSTSGGVQEYSPDGQLRQSIGGSSGAGPICFNPNGTRLVLPGVGLFDNTGSLLPSNWASVGPGRCVADGFGNVYVATAPSLVVTITKYDSRGNLVRTFDATPIFGFGPSFIDLAPDECSAYYGNWPGSKVDGLLEGMGLFNVCTNSQGPLVGAGFTDDVRVLPDWRILTTEDVAATLSDPSGQDIRDYYPGGALFTNNDSLRTVSLDPDGKSFWVCCTSVNADIPRVDKIFRFDINSGQLLATWPAPAFSSTAVYAPPLLGNANVKSTVDSNTAGTAEAFSTQARHSGPMTRLHLWVDSSSTASAAIVGIYSNRAGRPRALLQQGTITNLRPGSWNYVDLPSMSVTEGQRYWIAVLAPRGGGVLSFRDARGRRWRPDPRLPSLDQALRASETSARHNLSALPAQWSGAAFGGSSAPLSAYAS